MNKSLSVMLALAGIAITGIVFYSANTYLSKSNLFEINDLADSYKVGDTIKISITYDGKYLIAGFQKS